MKRTFIITLAAIALIAGCGKKQATSFLGLGGGSAEAAAPIILPATNDAPWTNAQTIYAGIDELRVRRSPDPSLPAINHLFVGDYAIYLGEKTEKLYTYELSGRTLTAPFVKIEMSNRTVGWVFAGGMTARSRRFSPGLRGPIVETSAGLFLSSLSSLAVNARSRRGRFVQGRSINVARGYGTLTTSCPPRRASPGDSVYLVVPITRISNPVVIEGNPTSSFAAIPFPKKASPMSILRRSERGSPELSVRRTFSFEAL
jgi:hypothetical protein